MKVEHTAGFKHTEAEPKWPSFSRRFEGHFLQWKGLNCNWNLIEICPLGFKWQYASIGSDKGLTPKRRQAIIWTSDCLIHWRIYVTRPQRVKLQVIIIFNGYRWAFNMNISIAFWPICLILASILVAYRKSSVFEKEIVFVNMWL